MIFLVLLFLKRETPGKAKKSEERIPLLFRSLLRRRAGVSIAIVLKILLKKKKKKHGGKPLSYQKCRYQEGAQGFEGIPQARYGKLLLAVAEEVGPKGTRDWMKKLWKVCHA